MGRARLRDTAAPGNDLRINLLPSLLLMVHDGLQQTIQVLRLAVVVVDEGVEATGQVGAQLRGVVPPHGLVADMELVLIIV